MKKLFILLFFITYSCFAVEEYKKIIEDLGAIAKAHQAQITTLRSSAKKEEAKLQKLEAERMIVKSLIGFMREDLQPMVLEFEKTQKQRSPKQGTTSGHR